MVRERKRIVVGEVRAEFMKSRSFLDRHVGALIVP